jgi:predicted DNA-binding protein (UPF0251 family)
MKEPTRQSGALHYSRRTPERVLRGPDAPGAKLSADDIDGMCALYQCGANQTWLARKYGVSRMTVWRHVRERNAQYGKEKCETGV